MMYTLLPPLTSWITGAPVHWQLQLQTLTSGSTFGDEVQYARPIQPPQKLTPASNQPLKSIHYTEGNDNKCFLRTDGHIHDRSFVASQKSVNRTYIYI